MRKHLIPVSFVLSGLALPAAVALASAGDADRFASFADGARASGTLRMTVRYSGDPETCAAAKTCGVSGTVVAKLRLDPDRSVTVRDAKVAVMRVVGSASATVRDTVAGHVCHSGGRVTTTGVAFKGDAKGVVLRVGVAPDDDPFDTACRAPTLEALGDHASPTVRLRNIGKGIDSLKLKVNATRRVDGGGYRGTVSTRGTVSLHG
jgi:hypothetical protein